MSRVRGELVPGCLPAVRCGSESESETEKLLELTLGMMFLPGEVLLENIHFIMIKPVPTWTLSTIEPSPFAARQARLCSRRNSVIHCPVRRACTDST